MIAGISLDASIAIFGTRGATTTQMVISALRKLGIHSGDRLVRMMKQQDKPPLCMVVLHFSDAKHTHWTVYKRGMFYDPTIGVVREYPDEVRQTSYLPIYTT
jgi:hypothetical protein